MGYSVALLGEAQRYKPGGRGFEFRLSHWNFSFTQPLTEMSTRNISWGAKTAVA